jgi:hypothetical protein
LNDPARRLPAMPITRIYAAAVSTPLW